MVGGKTIINEEVFIDLVKTAMTKVEEVAISADDNNSFAAIAKKVAERVAPQVNVKKTDAVIATDGGEDTPGHVAFEVKATMIYGANIPSTIVKLREMIVKEVEEITCFQVDKIDVIVEKLIKPEEINEDKPEN